MLLSKRWYRKKISKIHQGVLLGHSPPLLLKKEKHSWQKMKNLKIKENKLKTNLRNGKKNNKL
jgi:hypothetical protein